MVGPMRRIPVRWALALLVGAGLPWACNRPAAPARAPTLAEMGDEEHTCSAAAPNLEPMIVEWSGTKRSDFQRRLEQGLVVVDYEGCSLHVLDGCRAPGRYAYGGLTKNADTWNIGTKNELYARLPIGAASLAGDLEQSKGLSLDYALVGWYGAVLMPALGKQDLLGGDACKGATHFVRRVQLGAYRLASAGSASAGAGVGFVGGRTAGSESIVRRGGDIAVCAGGKSSPEHGCDVPIQLQLAPLSGGSAPSTRCSAGEELYVDSCVASSSTKVECPTGTSLVDGNCAGKLCPEGTELMGSECVRKAALTHVECPAGTSWNGRACAGAARTVCPDGSVDVGGSCVRKVVVTEVECPSGTSWNGSRCVGSIDLRCPPGLVATPGRGCVPVSGEVPRTSQPVARQPARTDCPSGMALVPGGTFQMGSAAGEGAPNELPAHAVTVATFCMDRLEVSAGQYAACAAAGACAPAPTEVSWSGMPAHDSALSRFCNGGRPDRKDYPINCVDWNSASAYCRWAGKRLPTERQWEFAARGTADRIYPWGNAPPSPQRLNACGSECVQALTTLGSSAQALYPSSDGYAGAAPVGSFPAGATPDGILDLAGNVWEWTASYYGPYPDEASSGTDRVYRGGGWTYGDPAVFRGARRGHFSPDMRSHNVGFRCAL